MIVKVEQLLSKPDSKYPYNYRVEFFSDPHESEQINCWIDDQGFDGMSWSFYLSGNRVFYTTEVPAMLCKLRWS